MDEKKVGQAVNASFDIIRAKIKENLIQARSQGSVDVENDKLYQMFAIVDSTLSQCIPNVVSAVKRAK